MWSPAERAVIEEALDQLPRGKPVSARVVTETVADALASAGMSRTFDYPAIMNLVPTDVVVTDANVGWPPM